MLLPFCSFRWGNVVLSRYPIQETSLVDYPAHSTWEALLAGKKRGVVCTVELPEGRRIRLLAVHLEHRSEPVRYRSAQVIERLRRRRN
jgi:endonuclease/exonuclease/phosphatase family metal-dependent hydrolase